MPNELVQVLWATGVAWRGFKRGGPPEIEIREAYFDVSAVPVLEEMLLADVQHPEDVQRRIQRMDTLRSSLLAAAGRTATFCLPPGGKVVRVLKVPWKLHGRAAELARVCDSAQG